MSLDSAVIAPDGPPDLYDVDRGHSYAKPRWRGWMHLVAFEIALVIGTIVVVSAKDGWQTADAAVYASTVAGLFGASALYHRGQWTPKWSARLQRVDHIMIVMLIAGSASTPMQVCLPGSWKAIGLITLWTLALAAITVRSLWMNAPERVVGSIYVALGWVAGTGIPAVWIHAGVAPAVLLLAGGLLYTLGAIGYHRRRPNPSPLVFGYHEVFHTCVTVAAACQYVAIAVFLL